jgi:RHS repeat-associated protein
MPGRKYNSNKAVYGFNGKRKDNEMYGEGNAYDYGERMYDPRVVKWLSLDPMMKKYANESPYLYTGGNPILFKDPDGRDRIITINLVTDKGTYTLLQITTDIGVYKKTVDAAYIWGTVRVNNENMHETYTIDLSTRTPTNNPPLLSFSSTAENVNKYETNIISYGAELLGMKDFNDPKAVAKVQEFGFILKGNEGGTSFDLTSDANHKEILDLSTLLGAASASKDLSGQFPGVIDLLKKAKVGKGVADFLERVENVEKLASSSEALESANKTESTPQSSGKVKLAPMFRKKDNVIHYGDDKSGYNIKTTDTIGSGVLTSQAAGKDTIKNP